MDIKPCPFCGNDGNSEPLAVQSGICVGMQRTAVFCGACFGKGPSVHDSDVNANSIAIRYWNAATAQTL